MPVSEITNKNAIPSSSGGRRLRSTEYTPHTGIASRISASPVWNSRRTRLAGSPRAMMTRMPAREISIPATCLFVPRSRSIAQEHSSMKAGNEELIRTAFTAVVVFSPA